MTCIGQPIKARPEAVQYESYRSEYAAKNAFLARVERFAVLTQEERSLVENLASRLAQFVIDEQIIASDSASYGRIILSGWAVQERFLSNGRRQIIRFIIPGDIVGELPGLSHPRSTAITALTPVTTADARPLLQFTGLASNGSGLARAIWGMHELDIKCLYDHVVRLGQQSAYQAILHLFLELHRRLDEIGQVADCTFNMPLSQELMGDCLGVSLVHFNRTVQQLRKDGFIELKRGSIKLLRLAEIKDLVDWEWD
jgi:CRP-like cAMP-binding protein